MAERESPEQKILLLLQLFIRAKGAPTFFRFFMYSIRQETGEKSDVAYATIIRIVNRQSKSFISFNFQ
jgi:hypothetical protein